MVARLDKKAQDQGQGRREKLLANKKIPVDDIVNAAIAEMMRDACPVEGRTWAKYMRVELSPGDDIPAHAHKRHLVLYYPEDAEPVVVTPRAGALLYLPPQTLHHVPTVKRPRVSYAMLVDE